MSYHEKPSGEIWVGLGIGLVSAWTGSFLVNHFDESSHNAATQDRLATIQLLNHQIEGTLDNSFENVQAVVLNDHDQTFSFTADDDHEVTVTCTGNYEVAKTDANIVGKIACTSETDISNQ